MAKKQITGGGDSSAEKRTESLNSNDFAISDYLPEVIEPIPDTTHQEDSNEIPDSLQTKQTDDTSQTVSKRISSKQRKESLEEYREIFLTVPKLEDRKPVFVSRQVRDQLDEIVRKLGGRRMSVSGFIENLTRHHLEIYRESIEQWKKL